MHTLYLSHQGVQGQKWGVRRYQNEDGSYKPGAEGRYNDDGEPGPAKGHKSTNESSKKDASKSGKKTFWTPKKIAVAAGITAIAASLAIQHVTRNLANNSNKPLSAMKDSANKGKTATDALIKKAGHVNFNKSNSTNLASVVPNKINTNSTKKLQDTAKKLTKAAKKSTKYTVNRDTDIDSITKMLMKKNSTISF